MKIIEQSGELESGALEKILIYIKLGKTQQRGYLHWISLDLHSWMW